MKFARNFLFLVLAVLIGFFLGGWLSSLSLEQPSGLAGPGIVAGWAIIGAIVGLFIGVILIMRLSRKSIASIAIVGLVLLAGFILFFGLGKRRSPKKATEAPKTVVPISYRIPVQATNKLGIGMAKPTTFESTLYFFRPNLQKAQDEHTPIDSIAFRATELGPEISYAPPWFYPSHMKMDYQLLYFKALGMTQDWVEIEVNKQTGQRAWVSAYDVNVIPWFKFLLSVHSIEINDLTNNPLRARPLAHSSTANITGEIYQPIEVRDQWLKVRVLDQDYKEIGFAWVKWHNEDQLLISYSLLS